MAKHRSQSHAPRPSDAPRAARYPAIDALRGIAIALMFAYHFTFDLNYFGLVRFDFNHDPFWLAFRAVIVSLFTGLVGASLFLWSGSRRDWQSYRKRLLVLAAFALSVSAASFVMFPQEYIFFGILHFIFVASVLGLAYVRLVWLNLALGAVLVAVGTQLAHPFFDQRPLQWFGLMTHKPYTQDYVPLLPWFGVVLIGLFAAWLAHRTRALQRLATRPLTSPPGRLLAFGGRHSLLIYMLHQPVFFAVLWLATRLA